jgi:UDP-N-acetylmuramate--alanine ligase
MYFAQVKKVHCVGIGGIGISAVAKWWLAQGAVVSGSDTAQSAITDDLRARGVIVNIGPSQAEWLPEGCELVIYSEAVPAESAERLAAVERGIQQLGHFDFLGELSKEYDTICVTGTNGKSTTTAMVGKILEAAELDPTVFVGSLVPGWADGNLRLGRGEQLVIEGDEYKQKMVKLFPSVTVITNIEEDHLDVYRDLDHIIDTFAECAEKTRRAIWVNADDKNSREMVKRLSDRARRLVQYYSGQEGVVADLVAQNRQITVGQQTFEVRYDDAVIPIELQVPGAFNVMNAAAAMAASMSCSVRGVAVQTALRDFSGIWRRFERVGEYNGALIISDYGHHPTAIRGTVAAAREFFPGRRLVLLFEPHQHSRTKELFEDFAEAFAGVDVLVLAEIYRVAGRTEDTSVTSKQLLEAVMATENHPGEGRYAADLAEAEAMLRALVLAGDVVIVMGAGKVDVVARNLVK